VKATLSRMPESLIGCKYVPVGCGGTFESTKARSCSFTRKNSAFGDGKPGSPLSTEFSTPLRMVSLVKSIGYDQHATAAAGAWVGERLRGGIGLDRLFGRRRGQVQELARRRDRLGAIAAGEQAIVADAMEALGQDVDEEAADELADVERHRGVAAGGLDPVVLDLEGDAPLVAIRRRFGMATRWVYRIETSLGRSRWTWEDA
jgi:hypothetical protein